MTFEINFVCVITSLWNRESCSSTSLSARTWDELIGRKEIYRNPQSGFKALLCLYLFRRPRITIMSVVIVMVGVRVETDVLRFECYHHGWMCLEYIWLIISHSAHTTGPPGCMVFLLLRINDQPASNPQNAIFWLFQLHFFVSIAI